MNIYQGSPQSLKLEKTQQISIYAVILRGLRATRRGACGGANAEVPFPDTELYPSGDSLVPHCLVKACCGFLGFLCNYER